MLNMKGSPAIEWILLAAWAATALPLAFVRLRRRWVFLLSCLLALPFMMYDTYRHGLPEMGGIPHVASMGFLPVLLRWAVRRRWYRPEK